MSGELVTASMLNTYIRDQQNILKTPITNSGQVEFAASTELTIASGVITPTQNMHSVDTEGSAASDDIDTITVAGDVGEGFVLTLQVESDARTVVLKTGTGGADNLDIGPSDITLDESYSTHSLIYDGANWKNFSYVDIPTFASISPLTTRGDTLVATSGTVTGTRLAVGGANTVLTSDGTDAAWAAAAGGGKVIQVVSENLTTDNSYNGLAQNEVIDLSITPAHADNKIMVLFTMDFKIDGDSNTPYPESFISLWRGDKTGTLLQAQLCSGGYVAHNTIYIIQSGSLMYLDSPSTTSAQEYTITSANRQNTGGAGQYRGRIYFYGDGTVGGQPVGTDLPFLYKNGCALTLVELDYS